MKARFHVPKSFPAALLVEFAVEARLRLDQSRNMDPRPSQRLATWPMHENENCGKLALRARYAQ